MIKIIFSFVLVSFFGQINAQSELDSLRKVAKILMMTDRDAYFKVSDKVIDLLKKNKNDSLLALYYLSRSMMHQIGKEYNKALNYNDSVIYLKKTPIELLNRAELGKAEMMWKLNYPMKNVFALLENAKKTAFERNDSVQLSSIYFRYSSIYMEKGNFLEAIKAMKMASTIRPKILYYPKLIDFSKLSKLFLLINDLDKAEFYYKKSREMAVVAKYKLVNKQLAVLGSFIEKRKGNYLKADSLLNIALDSYRKSKSKSDVFSTLVLLLGLGFEQGDKTKIEKYLKLTNSNIKFAKDEGMKAKYFLLRAKLNLDKKDFISTENDLKFAKEIIEQIHNLPYDIEYIKTLTELEKEKKNFAKSLFLNEKYHLLKDSLNRFQSQQIIFDIEEKYQAKEKQKHIELLEAKNALFETKINQEKLQKYLILGGAGVSLLFLFFLGITYYKVKEKNKLIEKTLRQKDYLLKEIHHRVKNNLQLITSLLNLQSKYIKDDKAKEVSMDGKNRVRAMSLIHQFLYQKEDLVNMELGEYFDKLIKELFEAYKVSEKRVAVLFDIERIEIDVDRVIPLGLIFNELITNILKYAFPDDRKGKIEISLKKVSNDIVFTVNDNGVGVENFNDMERDNSFGFTLIEALLQKWNGEFEIYAENGTKAKISIPFGVKVI